MKETGVLLFSLMIFITLSFATTQPKGGANLVGTQRARLNGFGEITGRVFVAESKHLLPGANVILLDTKSGRRLIIQQCTEFQVYRPDFIR